jgi:hypothetical protein
MSIWTIIVEVTPFLVTAIGALGGQRLLNTTRRKIVAVVDVALGLLAGARHVAEDPDAAMREAIETAAARLGLRLDAKAITRAVGQLALRASLAELSSVAGAAEQRARDKGWGQ